MLGSLVAACFVFLVYEGGLLIESCDICDGPTLKSNYDCFVICLDALYLHAESII